MEKLVWNLWYGLYFQCACLLWCMCLWIVISFCSIVLDISGVESLPHGIAATKATQSKCMVSAYIVELHTGVVVFNSQMGWGSVAVLVAKMLKTCYRSSWHTSLLCLVHGKPLHTQHTNHDLIAWGLVSWRSSKQQTVSCWLTSPSRPYPTPSLSEKWKFWKITDCEFRKQTRTLRRKG